jgi:hypothetical protein
LGILGAVTDALEIAKKYHGERVTDEVTNVTNFTEGWFRGSGIHGLKQIREIQERLRRDRAGRRQVVLELRKQEKTQAEVGALLGIDHRTVGRWESETVSNGHLPNTYTPPDYRVSIPKLVGRSVQKKDVMARGSKSATKKGTSIKA